MALLREQLRLVSKIKLDDRVTAAFLGEVLLQGSSKHINVPILNEIADTCDVLRLVNAQAHIREVYHSLGSPVSLMFHYGAAYNELTCDNVRTGNCG